ncbi:MAG: hypothetical protein K2X38_10570 [Gemmataceae bacterium]|nr:hypothetical protein [Gemmataceae bacterium]
MKKSLLRFGAVLSLLAATSANAQAFCLLPGFGLWGLGCNKYANIMICKPYNAFTPFCSGISYGNGCAPSCPQPCPMPCPQPCAMPCAPSCLPGADACTSAYRGMPMNMAYGYGYGYGYGMPQTVPVAYYGYYGYPVNAGYQMPAYAPQNYVTPVNYMPYYWAR